MNYYSRFMTIMVMTVLFFACEDQVVVEAQPKTKSTEKVGNRQCENRQTLTLEELADVGSGFNKGWYGGELDRLLRFCEVGIITNCQNFEGTEDITDCCFDLFFFDFDQDGLFSASEQDAILGFIMARETALAPSCANATLIKIDAFRTGEQETDFGFTARYMCCGYDEF